LRYIQSMMRPYAPVIKLLRDVGVRPTRQRLALARLLFGQADRHVTAEQLHEETRAARVSVSLATIYNTLHQFTAAGLLREVVVDPGRSYFDTNTRDHHHFYFETTGALADIPRDQVGVTALPPAPPGTEIERVDIVVRVRDKSAE
jgi:Fur family transcriptional regulator, iron response regulator